jgi:hypothetical protein
MSTHLRVLSPLSIFVHALYRIKGICLSAVVIPKRGPLALNEEGVDSDDNDGNDQETLSRRLLEKQFEPSLLEVNYITARDDRLRQTDIPERLQVYI